MSSSMRPEASEFGLGCFDPRTKVLASVLFILSVNLVPTGWWATYVLFLVLLWGVSVGIGVGIGFLVRRSLVAIPFVLAAIVVPFTAPGPPVFELPWLGWSVSQAGLDRFLTILFRFWLAVQGAVLLTAVTKVPELLWALGRLGVPRTLVSIIGFMYRYIFVIGEEASQMIRARAARSVSPVEGRRRSILWQGRVSGLMVGSLFLRALSRSERIYAAMLSRRYDGTPRSMLKFRMLAADWGVLICGAAVLLAVLMGRFV